MSPETNTQNSGAKTPENVFAGFLYAEVKDLAKQFLTLIAGTLVLSVSFADRLLPLDRAIFFQKALLGACWLLLLAALGLAGLGIHMNYRAAEQATGGVIFNYQQDFRSLAARAYMCLDGAGILFVLALFALAVVGASRLVVPR